MKELSKHYHIDASPHDVFEALTVSETIQEWTGGETDLMNPQVDGNFSLWGGDITGKNLEIVPNQRLKQEWKLTNWKEPSLVTIDLIQSPEGTIVEFSQTNIPDEDFESISKGWDEFYFGAIQDLFEDEEE
jgi:uncharacterized protein YndB with AHSA1/START domain